MALAILVVDRNPAMQQCSHSGGIERGVELHIEQCLDLIEQEAAVAVGAGNQCIARIPGERNGPANFGFGTLDQSVQCLLVQPPEDEYLTARQESGVELEARVLG